MRTILKKTSLFVLTMLLAPFLAISAEVSAKSSSSNNFNVPLVGLVCLMCILAIAILVLGNVLTQLTQVYRDKMRQERQNRSQQGLVKTLLLLVSFGLLSTGAYAADADAAKLVVDTPQYISGLSNSDFYIIMGVLALELLVIYGLIYYIKVLARLIGGKPAPAKEAKTKTRSAFWDRLHNVVPIEKEKDIMLDHDYDGIHELDNSLPPWWKYGFYITIIFACIYIYRFHVSGSGPSSQDEYAAEMKEAEIEKAAYLAKSANNVDENTVADLKEAADLTAGQQIFQSTCAACHAKDGGGGVGPNLTDDYWLHGGSIKDVFKSIKYGWQDKGMKSWKDDFSPRQIAQIASYVRSLRGTRPAAPKDKQGELFAEPNGTSQDSSKADKVAVK